MSEPSDVPLWQSDVNAPLEAEIALLGAALCDETGEAAKVLFRVPAEDFAVPHHADVASAMYAAMNGHPSPDPAEVASVLRERGEAGSLSFFKKHVMEWPTRADAPLYAKRVRFFAHRRREHALRTRLAQAQTKADQDKAKRDLDDFLAVEAQDSPDPWPEAVPLDHYERPAFPVDALPPVMRDWSDATAEQLQVPVDVPGMLCLAVTAACVARKFEAQIRPGWIEPLNLYEITALPPGGRKSAAFAKATAPLYDYEIERQQLEAKDRIRAEADYKAAEKKLANANDRRASAKNAGEANEAAAAFEKALKELADTPEAPAVFRMIGDDLTPESVVKMMSEQGDRFAVFSPEGGMLQTIAGSRYSKTSAPSYDALLKAHAGDPIAHDRKGSDPVSVRRPALTLGLCVQPQILSDLAAAPGARGVGLLARFLYSVPADKVGSRSIRSTATPEEVSAMYRGTVRNLLDTPTSTAAQIIPFNNYADDAMAAFEAELEPRLGPDGDLRFLVEWASKLAGAVARIATGFAIVETAPSAPEYVELHHVERALQIGRYLLAHAHAALGQASMRPEIAVARRILEWVRRHEVVGFSTREAFKAVGSGNSSIQRVDEVRPAIAVLIEAGEIRATQPPRSSAGGRPYADFYAVRPKG